MEPFAADEPARRTEVGLRQCDLRARWRTVSLASGWRFPGDWDIPEVDRVCGAVLRASDNGRCADAESAIADLAGARAHAGTGLAETFGDLAALHAVLHNPGEELVAPDVDSVPSRVVRLAAMGWSEVSLDAVAHAQVADSLTGLPTVPYLRTRLAELYRGVVGADLPCAQLTEQRLVTVRLDCPHGLAWERFPRMVMMADALRTVFCSGESLVRLGATTVAALTPGPERLPHALPQLRHELDKRLSVDKNVAGLRAPEIAVTTLPPTYEAACNLLDTFAGEGGAA